MAVHRGVGQHDALFLRGIAAPEQVLLQEAAEVLPPHRAVEGTDQGDIQPGGLFQHILHLHAVLAHDVGVIAAGLVQIIGHEIALVGKEAAVEGAEGAEGIGGEEDLVRLVIAHHDLGPVNHGGHKEGKFMPAGGEDTPLFHQVNPVGQVQPPEKLTQHGFDLVVAEDAGLRMAQQQALHCGGMVRLHMGDDQVIQGPAAQGVLQILKEGLINRLVYGIKQDGFLVQQQVGIVGNTVRNAIHALETGQAAVVSAHPNQIVRYFSGAVHSNTPPCHC